MAQGLKRILPILLTVLAAIVLILVILGFVLIRQSFPQIDGSISITGLDGEVEVIRDSMGVPHIYASTLNDLFMAQGFVHAQDRFFQMDFSRHVGSGRVSEMFGNSQIDTDIFLRTMGWERIAQEEFAQMDAEAKAHMRAYANGVNAYLANHSGAKLSFEYVILSLLAPDYAPPPWEPVNTLTWAKVMAFDLSGNRGGWADLHRAQLLKILGEERAREFFPAYPEKHPYIIPDEPFGEGYYEIGTQFTSQNSPSSESWTSGPFDHLPGSNNWVVSDALTETSAPILANDPHLGVQLPSIWYEVGLHCQPMSETCPINVTGFSFPGVPAVIIGHNDRIAWGVTNTGPDVFDLYIEKINPANPNQYEVNGEWVDMVIVQEQVNVAGGEPITIEIRYTRHGPIFSDVDEAFDDLAETTDLEVPDNYAVSVRWTALETTEVFATFLDLADAANWDDFRHALENFAVPAQNFVYADVDGNIGYQTPGRIPIRAGGDGLLPVPGWTDDYEWLGYIPYDELPYSFNPPQGYLVTANNPVIGPEYKYSISKTWDLGYRAQRIQDLIESDDRLSIEDMQIFQGDNYDPMGQLLVPFLTEITFDDQKSSEIVADLGNWDFMNDMDSAEAAFFNAFWNHLLITTFGDEFPDDIPGSARAFLIMETLVQEPDSAWWDIVNTTKKEGRDEVFHIAVSAAIEELEGKLGRNPDNWTWGDLHTITFENQLGIGPLGLIFNRGPFPTSGGSSMVNNTGWGVGSDYQVGSVPSMRMVVDLSELSNSYTMHTTGQSGHAFHKHYIDMAEPWGNIEFHSMLWTRVQVEADAEGHLTLIPE
ncbi:MAG: penicillin acylase family protein [Anaerolineales bacterium]|nr:penicillin acylase family protein [Anaerolineales bacterium]